MIVLIEGLNCTGKTTMAENFSRELKIPVVKFNVHGPEPYREFIDQLHSVGQKEKHFIVDRMHLSNYAYDGCLGGGVMTPSEWEILDSVLNGWRCYLYWMVDTPHAIEERMKLRTGRTDGAETMPRGQIGMIHNRFQTAYSRSIIEKKGSFTLPQFVDDGYTTRQFKDQLRILKMEMAGIIL